MGFRFRKSIKAGPLRINLSKSGVGYSVGSKGFRYTKKAGGGTRTTVSIPGTGISHVSETSSKPKSVNTGRRQPAADIKKERCNMSKPKSQSTELILCILLGWAGGHKFYNRKCGLGILYLLTCGLFTVGWIGDAIKLVLMKFSKNPDESPRGVKKVAPYIAALLCATVLGSCGGANTDTPAPTEPTEIVTEATEEVTEEVTEPETEAPTEAPTEEPTEAPTEATEPPTEAPTQAPTEAEEEEYTYLLNTNTKKFHETYCSRGPTKESNMAYYTGSRDEVIAKGYEPCKVCNP